MLEQSSRLSGGNDFFDEEYLLTNLRERAVKGAGVSVFSQVLSYVIQVGGSIVLARLLTPQDFGLVAMVSVVWLLLLNFGQSGFTEAIVQRKNLKSDEVNSLFWINLSISFGISLLFILSSPLLARLYNEERVTGIAMVMAFSIICMGLSTEHIALLKRGMMFGKIAVNDVMAAVLSVAIGIGLALSGFGYWALAVKQAIYFLFSAVGAWILCAWRPGTPSFAGGIGGMVKYAMYTYTNYCVTYFSRNFAKVLVGKFIGVQALGFYDRGYAFSGIFANPLTVSLSSVAVSALSRFSDEREKFCLHLRSILSMIAFLGMGLSLILMFVGEDLIILLLGLKWKVAGQVFAGFGAGMGFFLIYTTSGWIHLSLGNADRWLRWGSFGFMGTTVACLLGLRFGPVGVAIANSLFFLVFVIPALGYAGKPMKLGMSFFLGAMWKYWLSGVTAGCVCWYVTHSLSYTSNFIGDLNIAVRIFVTSILCSMVYMILVVSFYRSIEPISQLISLLREMVRRS